MSDNYNIEANDLDANATPDSPAAESSATEQQQQLFKYNAAGKEVEEPIDVVLKRASQGYHYAQEMQRLNEQKAAWEKDVQTKEAYINELQSKWSPYETYAKENPEWAEHVRVSWENRTGQSSFNGQSTGTQAEQVLPQQVRSELDELRAFKDEFRGFKESMQAEKEDVELTNQIKSTASEYSDIDFAKSDPETGKSLEFKVLEHMQIHGLNNFKAAFRDFYHDQLLARAVTKAKEDTANTIRERNQQGFVSESASPYVKPEFGGNRKTGSYAELIDDYIKENNIT